ncbi:MAG: LPP20 family lipoprotein [Pseudomonadota bacterium]
MRVFFTILLSFIFVSCVLHKSTAWIDGKDSEYSEVRYFTAVGMGEDRQVAEDDALAGIAKVFKAKVESLSKDYIQSLTIMTENNHSANSQEVFEQITKVSTDRVIKGVTISKVTKKDNTYYALAVLDRIAAKNRLLETMMEIDEEISLSMKELDSTNNKIIKIRKLNLAQVSLIKREAINQDFRILSGSGQGYDPKYKIADINNLLEKLLYNELIIKVKISGDEASRVENTVLEALAKNKFTVKKASFNKSADLLIEGNITLSSLDHPNKEWFWYKYNVNINIIDLKEKQTIATLSNLNGKEAQLTLDAARIKAINTMEKRIMNELENKISEYVFGK